MWQNLLCHCIVFTRASEEFAPHYLAEIRHDMRQTTRGSFVNPFRSKNVRSIVGDSHAYATRVKNRAETFPSQLEKYLNQNIGQRIVKVLNFGVPGYNTAQELEILKTKVLMFEPKMVILQ